MTRDLILPPGISSRMQEVESCLKKQVALLPPTVIPPLTCLTENGKRIRALIVLLCGYVSGNAGPGLIQVAAACELFHLATLIHDDIIDEHQDRRGFPALYRQISPASAVLIADFIFARSYALFLQCKNNTVMEIMTKTLTQITNAELRAHLSLAGRSFDLDDYLAWISDKTASLFRASAACGAVLGGADEAGYALLSRYGEFLGVSFQIRDDVLDYVPENGKIHTAGSDLKSGMVTLPLIYHNMIAQQTPAFHSWLRGFRDPEGISALIREVRQSGAITASMDHATGYASNAEELLKTLPKTPERDALISLCRYCVTRDQ